MMRCYLVGLLALFTSAGHAAIRRDRRVAENLIDVCEILIALGCRAEAIERCRSAIKVAPEYARAKAMLRRAGGR